MKLLEIAWEGIKKRVSESALFLAILLVLGALGAMRGREVVAGVAQEETAPLKRQVDEHEQKLKFHSDDLHELGKDMRELYLSQRTGRRSERLEAPFPAHDGGEP